jgi:hypothetical protein
MTNIDDRSKSTDPRCSDALRSVRPSWPSPKEWSHAATCRDELAHNLQWCNAGSDASFWKVFRLFERR